MEEGVGEGVHPQAVKGGGREGLHVADHVVPLQQLMQHDAVDEAAEPHPEEQPDCDAGATTGVGRGILHAGSTTHSTAEPAGAAGKGTVLFIRQSARLQIGG